MRIVILGCGYHGRGITFEIAAAKDVGEVVVADRDMSRAPRILGLFGDVATELSIRLEGSEG